VWKLPNSIEFAPIYERQNILYVHRESRGVGLHSLECIFGKCMYLTYNETSFGGERINYASRSVCIYNCLLHFHSLFSKVQTRELYMRARGADY